MEYFILKTAVVNHFIPPIPSTRTALRQPAGCRRQYEKMLSDPPAGAAAAPGAVFPAEFPPIMEQMIHATQYRTSRCFQLFLLFCLPALTACMKQATPLTDIPTITAVSQPHTPSPQPPTPSPPPTLLPSWPTPLPTYEPLSRAPVTAVERETFDQLAADLPPDRDDVALAVAYRGIDPPQDGPPQDGPPPGAPPPVSDPLPLGTVQQLYVSNVNNNTTTRPDFELLAVGDYAYFWFDATPGLDRPDEATLRETAAAFDDIYEQVIYYFGPEDNPGVDGDPRVHVVNASPLTVCDVTLENAGACGLLGYVATSNTLPTAVYPTSNQREMFVMNGAVFGTQTYLSVLAHEFRHMIESRYDVNDTDWAVEGSAVLAEDLLGFSAGPVGRANIFLENPDQQLNHWTDGYSAPYYGQAYLFNRYLFNRLGEELYREFAMHPHPGFISIDAIAAAHDLDAAAEALWLDWLAALAIHNEPGAPEIYRLRDGVNTAALTPIDPLPFASTTTVSQYAADYYQLPANGRFTLAFTGSNHVPLLDAQPVSGARMWLANRANYSMARLTRAFDLSNVAAATLEYAVYHDIEYSYDFAYVAISPDNGRTWQALTAPNMQGETAADDPSGVAYTDRFYTGRSAGWVKERIDLTPYAGGPVQIRFEYVTDPILTFGGLALDNIAIPEIGFFDDVETDAGWQAEGFVRAAGYAPQQWYAQLITFDSGVPLVNRLKIDDNNRLTLEISAGENGRAPILIIAAAAPMTLEPAHYRLEIE